MQVRPTQPRRDFWVVAAAFFVIMLGSTLPTSLYVIYQERFGFSTAAVTLVFAAYALGVLTALLLFGRASDVLGRRLVLLPGLACAAVSGIVFMGADGLGWLIVGRVLSGLAAGIFTGTATATLVDLAGEEHAERATLVATLANMGGLGTGPLVAGLLADLAPAPLRLPYAFHLVLLVVVTLGIWCVGETVPSRREAFRIVLPTVPPQVRGTFVRAALAGFAGFAVLGLFTAVWPAMLRRLVGIPGATLTGVSVFALFASSAVGQLALVRPLGRAALASGCALITAGMLSFAVGLRLESVAILVFAVIVAGLGQGVGFRSALGELNAAAPVDQRAELASSFFLVVYLAISLPVIGVGWAADTWGLRGAGIGFSGAVALLSASTMAVLWRERRVGATGSS